MDRIRKALKKLAVKEKEKIKKILQRTNAGNFQKLDIKKLKGKNSIFRVRKGNLRVIFHKTNDSIKVLSIERRTSKTYRKR